MKSLLVSAAFIIAILRLCKDRDHESEGLQSKNLPASFPRNSVENVNRDTGRPYDLFNFYYPPGQTSVRFH